MALQKEKFVLATGEEVAQFLSASGTVPTDNALMRLLGVLLGILICHHVAEAGNFCVESEKTPPNTAEYFAWHDLGISRYFQGKLPEMRQKCPKMS